MKDKLYYIPEIEEICYGLPIEIKDPEDSDWIKDICNASNIGKYIRLYLYYKEHDGIRVKGLVSKDIIKYFPFEITPDKFKSETKVFTLFLSRTLFQNTISIFNNDENYYCVRDYDCKNISELIKLLNKLGIETN
jgi:hypothetical protein